MNDQLIIFDTTLRDGEQSPGASMTRDEKLRIARQLERMRVNVIEAGFAAASNGDFEAVKAVAEAIKDSTICSLARANEADIRRAGPMRSRRARPGMYSYDAGSRGKFSESAAHPSRSRGALRRRAMSRTRSRTGKPLAQRMSHVAQPAHGSPGRSSSASTSWARPGLRYPYAYM